MLRSPNLMTSSGIGSAEIVVAPLVLSTYALMATALAGRATVDLSIGPLIGFINVTLIQLGAAGIVTFADRRLRLCAARRASPIRSCSA